MTISSPEAARTGSCGIPGTRKEPDRRGPNRSGSSLAGDSSQFKRPGPDSRDTGTEGEAAGIGSGPAGHRQLEAAVAQPADQVAAEPGGRGEHTARTVQRVQRQAERALP